MTVTRLNHAVLYVRDATRSAAFYTDVMGFTTVMEMGGGRAVFLRAGGSTNDHDLGLFTVGDGAAASPAGRGAVGLYHLAWEVATLRELADLQERLAKAGALVGASDHSSTKSLYAQDPDGIEFEVCWVLPASLLDETVEAGKSSIRPLDVARENERYGADTPGGIGVSVPSAPASSS
jgi:catechol-2,3-dioxygenase